MDYEINGAVAAVGAPEAPALRASNREEKTHESEAAHGRPGRRRRADGGGGRARPRLRARRRVGTAPVEVRVRSDAAASGNESDSPGLGPVSYDAYLSAERTYP